MIDCSKIPYRDKGCHAIAGFIIAIIIGLIFNAEFGFFIGLVAGASKEIYDRHDYGKADFYDMFSTMGGAFVGFMTVVILT